MRVMPYRVAWDKAQEAFKYDEPKRIAWDETRGVYLCDYGDGLLLMPFTSLSQVHETATHYHISIEGGPLATTQPEATPDMVNHPAHYKQGSIECIDAIKAALGRDGFVAFLRGQILKYTWRAPHKGSAMEDIRKARWYAERLIETLEEGS